MALFAEEILEHVLAHAVVTSASPHHRASWHSNTVILGALFKQETAPHPVSRACHRIASRSSNAISSSAPPHQSAALLQTLRAPLPGAVFFGMLERLEVLDVTLPNSDSGTVEDLAGAIQSLRGLRALRIRKGAGTYPNQPAPRALPDALTDAFTACPELNTVTLTFSFSGDPALSTLTAALAVSPALTTLRIPSPRCGRLRGFVWGSAASSSPSTPSPCPSSPSSSTCAPPACDPSTPAGKPVPPPRRASFPSPERKRAILPTTLFLSAARCHARLSELVRAGTDIAAGGPGVG
ncbi:hypothetical protein B0H13DRAFT_2689748 [Mycena leptocephala]|nr:hypothetical protein B0H13DRAFT_2689748 [Mycena leptocephala]